MTSAPLEARRTAGPAGAEGRRQTGFTLVELMVALTLGLLVLAGLITLFANTSSARVEIDKASRQIENGRYAMQTLADDIRHAGYFGALSNAPDIPAAMPDPCSTTTADVQAAIGVPVQAYAGAAAANLIAPGKLACINAAAGYKPDTAVLVVRRASTAAPAASAASGVFNIQVSGCAGDPVPYLLDVSTATFSLHTNTNPPGCTPITGANAALISPVLLHIYYVSTCSGTDCSAAGANSVPTLKRIDVTPTSALPTPVIDGIENLQFEYGLDASSPFDGAPDIYLSSPPTATRDSSAPPPSVAGQTWENLMAVRVHVLARNVDSTPGYTDAKTYALGPAVSVTPGGSFKRHAYNEVVRLTNPSGRRE